jgi:hypothetical protein
VTVLYLGVVGLFRLAFSVITTDHVLWFFLTFADCAVAYRRRRQLEQL